MMRSSAKTIKHNVRDAVRLVSELFMGRILSIVIKRLIKELDDNKTVSKTAHNKEDATSVHNGQ